jgi:hypothetical protein
MAASVIIEEQVHIPLDLRTLEEFRRGALSDDFPARGRIDYLGGDLAGALAVRAADAAGGRLESPHLPPAGSNQTCTSALVSSAARYRWRIGSTISATN